MPTRRRTRSGREVLLGVNGWSSAAVLFVAQTRFSKEIETRVWMAEVFICDYNKGIYNVDKKYELAEPSFQEMRRFGNGVDAASFQVSWESTNADLWRTRHLVHPWAVSFR